MIQHEVVKYAWCKAHLSRREVCAHSAVRQVDGNFKPPQLVTKDDPLWPLVP